FLQRVAADTRGCFREARAADLDAALGARAAASAAADRAHELAGARAVAGDWLAQAAALRSELQAAPRAHAEPAARAAPLVDQPP
ncbi:hypothetical protein, partial [Caballeronia sp. ATUFL_F2_KS42]|uniref:hypothetical protein n=1 Tax=Caballeronia sp. ATUFL_F2_KS42 TaxID=2921765 RepID=UPI00202849EF